MPRKPPCHCGDIHFAKGFCAKHYWQNRRKTDTEFREKDNAKSKRWRATESGKRVMLRQKRLAAGMVNPDGEVRTGPCESCGCTAARAFHLDHDHVTGTLRGQLCENCNRALGLLKDDPRVVLKLYEYIRARPHSGGTSSN